MDRILATHTGSLIRPPELLSYLAADCGFAQGSFIDRVHPEIQWAKLAALAEGARLASRELWGVGAG